MNNNKIIPMCLLTLFASTLSVQATENSKMDTSKTISFKKNSKFITENIVHNDSLNHTEHNCGTEHNGQDWEKLQKQFSKQIKAERLKSTNTRLNKGASFKTAQTLAVEGSIAEDGRYYIPIVFHIYGDAYNCTDSANKCLTDEKVIDALNKLNNDFQGLSVDSPSISPLFAAIRKNLDIEFVLAKKDPNGNVTNGIVRHLHEQAGFGNNSANSLIAADAWDNFKYMNVYLMNDLHDDGQGNNSGIAWYPELAMSNAGTARVVYNGNYVGVNTDENFRSVLTHEFGHWLNLIHTFEDKVCSITNEAFCKTTGDKDCDTPQMSLPQQMQSNAMNCLGQPTNTENFMHYTDNYAMFTKDQVDRMTAALHGPARSTLWSNENLISTGLELYTSDAEHYWDGESGVDVEAEGLVLETFDNISAPLNGVETVEINLPRNASNILFYLDGYTQDPDLYVSSGTIPTPPENGSDWIADLISFNAPGDIESVSIDIPNTNVPYFASIHAFTAFDNARLQVIQGQDPFLSENESRFTLFKIDDLWANKTDGMWTERLGKTHNYQFTVPEDATRVVIVVPGGYQGPKMANGSTNYNGDIDLHVSRNKEVSLESYDCRPYSWKANAEYCEFDGGGTFNVILDPFQTYTKASLHVYYETENTGNQLPFANTNGDKYEEAVNHNIQFSSKNSNDPDGTIVDYLWDFGDGTQSTEAEAIHAYSTVGNYDVTLTVTDNLGERTTATTKALITINSPNDAPLCDNCTRFYLNDEINLSSEKGAAPKDYQFEVPDAASLVTFEFVSRYNGDPDIYVGQNKEVSVDISDCRPWEAPSQTELCQFTSGGIFNVMIDPYLAYDSLRFRAYYDIRDDVDHSGPNRFPVSIPGDDYTGRVDNVVTLNGQQSTDEDGNIVEYVWDFGNDITKTGVIAEHSFPYSGVYSVILTVTDNKGASHSSSTQVTIVPVGDMDGDGDVDNLDIRALSLAIRNGEDLDPSFDINNDGVINSRDSSALRDLCSYDRCSSIKPAPQAPIAAASADKQSTSINSEIQFNSDSSTDQYGRIVSFAWDFGDGNSSDFSNPTHQYTQAGIYDVTLTVTDNDDMTASSTITINVNHPPLSDVCSITAADNTGDLLPSVAKCVGTKKGLTFNHMNRDGHKTVAISMINAPEDSLIYFGDGGWPKINTGEFTAVSTAQGEQQCIFYTIPEDANYWGYITLTGAPEGATIVVDYDVASCRPSAIPNEVPNAIANAENGTVNADIQFSSAGSNDSDGQIVSYVWDFGDSTNSTLANPIHQYNEAGTYNATLTVTDNGGLSSIALAQVIINAAASGLSPLTDICAIEGATVSPRTLTPGAPGCIGTKNIFAFSDLKRGHATVAITLANAPEGAAIYFKDGGWPKISTGDYSVVSTTQGQQQCVVYAIPTDASEWGYIEISGTPEGATIVVDYDVSGCRPVAE